MFKRILFISALVSTAAFANIKVYDDNNFNLDVSTNFCASTVDMNGVRGHKGDRMVVTCIGNRLFSGLVDKTGGKTLVTPVVNLGYPCYCNSGDVGDAPKGIMIDVRNQWREP